MCVTLTDPVCVTELQGKYEQQRVLRESAETKLLEVEKTKSELSVDLSQLKQQVGVLKTDLHAEIEKVSEVKQVIGSIVCHLFVLSPKGDMVKNP